MASVAPASRLHNSTQDLLEQLEKAAEEFRSYGRKLELSVDPEDAEALGLASRLRKLERTAEKVRGEVAELQEHKREILMAAKDALLRTSETLSAVEAMAGEQLAAVGSDRSLADLTEAIGQWQAVCIS